MGLAEADDPPNNPVAAVLIYPVLLMIELQQVAILATREPSQGHLFTQGRDGLKIAAQKVPLLTPGLPSVTG